MHNPFARPKPNPKRTKERRVRGREILHGEAKTAERRRIFERSGGFCEALIGDSIAILPTQEGPLAIHFRCNRPITWETMQWSHPRHGPYKDDREGIASCKECHEVGVHNPKSVPRKPGRLMNQTEALAYWKGMACFCGDIKRECSSFCLQCLNRLDPQLQYDVQNATGEDYLRAMALAEQELLAWKPAEEQAS